MPVYAYQCEACGHSFEAKQRFSDDPITDCPDCDQTETVFRVIQPAGVVFKGSGWYVTDSRRNGDSGNGNSNGHSSNGKSTSDTSSTSAKPSEKTTTSAD